MPYQDHVGRTDPEEDRLDPRLVATFGEPRDLTCANQMKAAATLA